jgi:hypothetical protein
MNAHSLRTILRRRNLLPLTCTFLFLLVCVCGCVASGAQSPEKGEREVVDKIPKHLPIKVKVKKPEKLKDAKNEEWLGELELEVTNTGTKPIYFLDIILDMPDVFAPNGLNIAYRLHYGRIELISFREPVRPDDVPILPGGVAVISAPAVHVENWKRSRARGTLTNPKRIEFLFQQINFGDGTGFLGTDGGPIPSRRERSANATCTGGDSAGEVASVTDPPRYHFPELASLITLLPPPANLVPAFFIPKRLSPEPGAAQDLCCASGCSRLIASQDQGCPCPGVTRRTVEAHRRARQPVPLPRETRRREGRESEPLGVGRVPHLPALAKYQFGLHSDQRRGRGPKAQRAYISTTRSMARRQTAQKWSVRVNMMQSTSGR